MEYLVEWYCQVDSSGRISLPRQCREWLQDGCVLEYWPEEGCISGWPISKELDDANDAAWNRIGEGLGRKFSGAVRHTVSMTPKLYLDARGRLTIPKALRRQAGITGAVVVFAMWRYFEVWTEERWQSFLEHWKTDKHPFLGDWPEPPKWVEAILDEHC